MHTYFKKIQKIVAALIGIGVLGCSSSPLLPAPTQFTLTHGDARVGTYVSEGKGFTTSSYWIEGPKGLILIDTQFLLSAGKEAVEWAEKVTGKKVVLALILHPNPDKFNGTAQLQARGIPVLTSKQVLEMIPSVHRLRKGWFYERFKPDYPSLEPRPMSFGDRTQEIQAAGITLKAHVLNGPGCSAAHVVVEYEGHFFVGDLVTNQFHSWLEIGQVDEWIKRIEELEELEADFVHPGRGPSGGAELLTQQKFYLERVQSLVLAELKSTKVRKPVKGVLAKEPNPKSVQKVLDQIEEEFPGYRYPYFVKLGLPEVFKVYSSTHGR